MTCKCPFPLQITSWYLHWLFSSLVLSVLLTSDVFACCVLLESHIHRAFIAAFSYGTSNSADCTQGGTGRDNQPFWMPAFIYSHPSVQISFRNDSHEDTQEKWCQVLCMEHMIKPKCFRNIALGLCAHLAALRRTDPALPWWELVRINK